MKEKEISDLLYEGSFLTKEGFNRRMHYMLYPKINYQINREGWQKTILWLFLCTSLSAAKSSSSSWSQYDDQHLPDVFEGQVRNTATCSVSAAISAAHFWFHIRIFPFVYKIIWPQYIRFAQSLFCVRFFCLSDKLT